MKSGYPSLNVLTVFEAAARTLSFKAAAEELHITPPAVSHQIRSLEKTLGIKLFNRLNRAIELSDEGIVYYQEIRPALSQIHSATKQLLKANQQTTLKVYSVPFITNSLLMPNIKSFISRHPTLQIDIQSDRAYGDFARSTNIVAIRHNHENEPDLYYEAISRVFITPVCSQSYLAKHGEINITDIHKHRLLKMNVDKSSWSKWSQYSGCRLQEENVLFVDNYKAVLTAVEQDLGIGMGYFPMLGSSGKSTSIVPVYTDNQCDYGQIYFVCRRGDQENAQILSFKKWLVSLFTPL